MLTAAVAASRIVHPHLVGVYDAIDEGDRAYVVREWVDGSRCATSCRQSPLDADRATWSTHAVAEAVAALHAAGIAHGNIHPGTVLIADDGRVVLADARADGAHRRRVRRPRGRRGALLRLTGHWPHAEAGRRRCPTRSATARGRLVRRRARCAPASRPHLDELAVGPAQPAGRAAGGGRAGGGVRPACHDGGRQAHPLAEFEDDAGPMGFAAAVEATPSPAPAARSLSASRCSRDRHRRRLLGTKVLGPTAEPTPTPAAGRHQRRRRARHRQEPIALTRRPGPHRRPARRRPDRARRRAAVDGDSKPAGRPSLQPGQLRQLKTGMGILIDLGEPQVGAVQVSCPPRGATLSCAAVTATRARPADGDKAIEKAYTAHRRPTIAKPAPR